jgi:DNA repair exonuclease SbcCD ATPase subunit
MNAKNEQETFDEAIQSFESQFATPVVPGELMAWTALAKESVTELKSAFELRRRTYCRPQLEEIERQDPELLSRVQHMREACDELAARFEQLQRILDAITTPTDKVQDRESKMHTAIEKAVDDGLELAIEVRKHDKEVATWFVEAFQRDRGDVD